MNRRNFIKRSALFVPAIFIPKIIRATTAFTKPGFFRAKPAAGGGGDITTALVARWKFDEGTGTTTADATGNGHTGTIFNSTATTWVTGKIGPNALAFDGVSVCPVTITAITTSTTFTYAAWVNWSGGGGYQNLMAQANSIGLWLRFGQIDYYFSGDHLSSTALSTGVWQHIAVVCNAGAFTFYLDGAADGTGTGGTSFDANAIGCDSTGSEPFNGSQDDVRLYSRALSEADITALYAFTSQWFDSIDPTTTDSSFSQNDSGFTFSLQIALSTGGVAKKLRIKLGTVTFDGTGFKIALYDSSGSTLLGSATGTVNIADSNTVKEFAISPVSVTATTYMVAFKAQANTDVSYASKSGTSATSCYDHPTYVLFPASTLTTPFTNATTASAGILVESV